MHDVTVVLNTYKRKYTFPKQLAAVRSQSSPVNVVVWRNDDWGNLPNFHGVTCNSPTGNEGVWARFDYASQFDSPFYLVLDDDTIPGRDFVRRCLELYETTPAVYCAFGFRFKVPKFDLKTWNSRTSFGWPKRTKDCAEVDWPGHGWFFPKCVLQEFLEIPRFEYKFCGEDMHLAYSAQRIGLKCFTTPYGGNTETWGSLHGKYGADQNATYKKPKQKNWMLDGLRYYRERGWKWIVDK